MATTQRIRTKGVTPKLGLNLSSTVPWACVLGFVVFVVGGVAVRAGGLLEQLYPLAALAVGAVLYWRYPVFYLGFTWWLWFLTPEVRRIVDYQDTWNPQSPITLAPFLVTGLAFLTLLRHLPKLQFYRLFPFGLVLLGLFYGYSVGIYRQGWQLATYELLLWLAPIVFAFYLAVHWRSYPYFRRVTLHAFVWGVLFMGAYGLLQFLVLPAWDQYWMNSAGMGSIGKPEPFEVRVFSTLNAPGPFAEVVMVGLLLLSTGGGWLRWPAASVGYISFGLSLVRGAWGAWVIGIICVAAQRGRFSPRLLAGLLLTGLLAVPLLSIGPVADTIEDRLQSTTNIQEDQSFNERRAFYITFAQRAVANPIGEGLGRTGIATKLAEAGEMGDFRDFDSGLMVIPFVLGWPGTLLFLGGLAWLLFYAFRRGGSRRDLFAVASRAAVVALLVQTIFVNILVGVVGMVFWSFLALLLAARTYQLGIKKRSSNPEFRSRRGLSPSQY